MACRAADGLETGVILASKAGDKITRCPGSVDQQMATPGSRDSPSDFYS